MNYSGPPIRGNFAGGSFKVQGGGGGIKAGGASLAKAANNNSGCWNNLQCEDQFDERYGCVNSSGTGDCNNVGNEPGINCYCKCTDDNTDLGPCNTPTPTYSYMSMMDVF